MPDISTNYMGLKLKSPIIASSSGLTNSVNDIVELAKNGAGAIVLKSLFEEEILMEMDKEIDFLTKENYIYPESLEFYEAQHKEDTLTRYLKLISDCKKSVDIPIIASINCVTSHIWPYFAKSLQDAGADGLELNIFSLPSNVNTSGKQCESKYFEIIEAVKNEVTIPISIKTSYYFSNLARTITELSNTGIQAIVLFNRFYATDIDIRNFAIISANKYSNPTDYTLPLRWIGILSDRVNCDLSASTGVHNGETFIKMILAGASSVQVASTLYKNGFAQLKLMLNELKTWMNSNGFSNLDQVKGMLCQSKTSNPAGYMRVQFMKHFSEKEGV